jgi:hypothetical protein
VVALAEDDRASLTTDVVRCEPAEVRVGMRVRVRFEQQDDVHRPLVEPAPEALGAIAVTARTNAGCNSEALHRPDDPGRTTSTPA